MPRFDGILSAQNNHILKTRMLLAVCFIAWSHACRRILLPIFDKTSRIENCPEDVEGWQKISINILTWKNHFRAIQTAWAQGQWQQHFQKLLKSSIILLYRRLFCKRKKRHWTFITTTTTENEFFEKEKLTRFPKVSKYEKKWTERNVHTQKKTHLLVCFQSLTRRRNEKVPFKPEKRIALRVVACSPLTHKLVLN